MPSQVEKQSWQSCSGSSPAAALTDGRSPLAAGASRTLGQRTAGRLVNALAGLGSVCDLVSSPPSRLLRQARSLGDQPKVKGHGDVSQEQIGGEAGASR